MMDSIVFRSDFIQVPISNYKQVLMKMIKKFKYDLKKKNQFGLKSNSPVISMRGGLLSV